MMKQQTLREMARVVRKFGHHPSVERERQLIDSHLDALYEIEDLKATIRELRERGDGGPFTSEEDSEGFLILAPNGEEM